MKKKWMLIVVLVLSMVFLAACGGDKPAETTSTETTSTEGETKTSESGKTVMKALVSNSEKPLAWQDAEGKIQGYEYDVLLEVNKLLKNYELEIESVSPATQDLMMESGEAQLSVGGYYLNETRQTNYEVPENPIGASALLLYIKPEKADTIKSLQDVADQKLTLCPFTANGGTYKVVEGWNNANGNPLTLNTVEGMTAAEKVQTIADGQYDALVNPNNIGITDVIKELGLDVTTAETPIVVNKTIVIIKKGETEFAKEVNDALGTLMEKGKLVEISNKWYGQNMFDYLNVETSMN